jgi:hypothetical protein
VRVAEQDGIAGVLVSATIVVAGVNSTIDSVKGAWRLGGSERVPPCDAR